VESRARLLELLKRYGWNATGFQAVEPEFSYWFDPQGDAAVAYLDTGRAWVVAGAPIAAIERCAEGGAAIRRRRAGAWSSSPPSRAFCARYRCAR
jgi:lysylphosphatidylglycerol synthetase-like protein (DUF2156 family)